ncbi:putative adenosine monophosphate-protein transferase Fic [Plantactinospora mayteni]|uniref:protein adenylyltransferase n=1 Tax=Plantactinospora mayteni TaxID=566021 RepID=A0ABQ4ESR3_9ACTN|nr:Fic family protein [Plantactinospora mayteni]GIG97702.1 cell filamentation protein Fic [Plantactinospora mayteni]
MPDPYSWPGTECLRNRLGITDSARLALLEAKIVSIREVEIAQETIPGDYNLEHLKLFHHALFRDVHDWAGETRTVDIAKTGSQFCHWRFVDDQVSAVLAELAGDGHLIGYNRPAFVQELAHYYGELNARHPFREGNGRSLRAFLRQLAAAAGYHLDWSELSKHDNVRACRENLLTADTKLLVSVLDPVVRRI